MNNIKLSECWEYIEFGRMYVTNHYDEALKLLERILYTYKLNTFDLEIILRFKADVLADKGMADTAKSIIVDVNQIHPLSAYSKLLTAEFYISKIEDIVIAQNYLLEAKKLLGMFSADPPVAEVVAKIHEIEMLTKAIKVSGIGKILKTDVVPPEK